MKTYRVVDIAMLLDVDGETVRRWIRTGKLKSRIESKKKGHIITELDLVEFVDENPKYRHILDETGLSESDAYLYRLRKLAKDLIAERDRLNIRIDAILTLLEKEP